MDREIGGASKSAKVISQFTQPNLAALGVKSKKRNRARDLDVLAANVCAVDRDLRYTVPIWLLSGREWNEGATVPNRFTTYGLCLVQVSQSDIGCFGGEDVVRYGMLATNQNSAFRSLGLDAATHMQVAGYQKW
jgi:hypothetical protein